VMSMLTCVIRSMDVKAALSGHDTSEVQRSPKRRTSTHVIT
jgi:hypothetical protein